MTSPLSPSRGRIYLSRNPSDHIRILDVDTLDEVSQISTKTNENFRIAVSDYLESEEMNLLVFSRMRRDLPLSDRFCIFVHNSATNDRLSRIKGAPGVLGLDVLSSRSNGVDAPTPIILSGGLTGLLGYDAFSAETMFSCRNVPADFVYRIKCFPDWNTNEVFMSGGLGSSGVLCRYDLSQECVMLGSYEGHAGTGDRCTVKGISASPSDGGLLLSASEDSRMKGLLKLWSIDTRECVETVSLDLGCNSLHYSPNTHLICCGTFGAIEIWDIRNPKTRLRKIEDLGNEPVEDVCPLPISEDSSLYVSGIGRRVLVWNATTGRVLRRKGSLDVSNGGMVRGIQFLSTPPDQFCRFEGHGSEPTRLPQYEEENDDGDEGFQHAPMAIASSPGGKLFLSGYCSRIHGPGIRILDFRTWNEIGAIRSGSNYNYRIAISDYLESEEMNLVVSSHRGGTEDDADCQTHLSIHNSVSFDRIGQISDNPAVDGLEILSSHSNCLGSTNPIIVAGNSYRISAYDALSTKTLVDCSETVRLITRIKSFPDWNPNVVFVGGRDSTDNQGHTGVLCQYDLSQGFVMTGSYVDGDHFWDVNGISVCDGRILVSGSSARFASEGALRLWSIDSFECIGRASLCHHCYSLQYVPDSHLICCGTEAEVEIWDIRTMRRRLRKIRTFGEGGVRDMTIACIPTVVSVCHGKVSFRNGACGSVLAWNPNTGKILRRVALAVSPDGVCFLPDLTRSQIQGVEIRRHQRREEREREENRLLLLEQERRTQEEEVQRLKEEAEAKQLAQEAEEEEEQQRSEAEQRAEQVEKKTCLIDGKVYVSISGLFDVRMLDFEALNETDRIPTESSQNYRIAISNPEEMNLMGISQRDATGYKISIYDSITNERISQIVGVPHVKGLEILPTTPIVVAGGRNCVCAYDAMSSETVFDCDRNVPFRFMNEIRCVSEWNRNEVFIGGNSGRNGLLCRYDLSQGCVRLGSYSGHVGSRSCYVNGIAASLSDGAILISGSNDGGSTSGSLKLWSIDTCECIETVSLHNSCFSLHFDSGSHLICCGTREEIEVFDIRNVKRRVARVHNVGNGTVQDMDRIVNSSVESLSGSSSSLFVSGSKDIVSIWNPSTGRVLRSTVIGESIEGIRFLPALAPLLQSKVAVVENESEEEEGEEEEGEANQLLLLKQQHEKEERERIAREREEAEAKARRLAQLEAEEAERLRREEEERRRREEEEEERRRVEEAARRAAEERERVRQEAVAKAIQQAQQEAAETRRRLEREAEEARQERQRERERLQREATEARERLEREATDARMARERAEAEAARLAEEMARLTEQTPPASPELTSYELSTELITIHENQLLGRGGFTNVLGGVLTVGGADFDVAIKVSKDRLMLDDESDVRTKKEMEDEVKKMVEAKHQFVVKCFGWFMDEMSRFCIVLERCNGGDLRKWIEGNRGQISMERKLEVLSEVSEAMSFLHSLGFLHRDLKPENVLLHGGHVKLCDFGLMRRLASFTARSVSGTVEYLPNPIHGGDPKKIDVYAFGLIMFEVISEVRVFEEEKRTLAGGNPHALLGLIYAQQLRPNLDRCPPDTPDEIRDLISASWSELPADRPMFAEIVCDLARLRGGGVDEVDEFDDMFGEEEVDGNDETTVMMVSEVTQRHVNVPAHQVMPQTLSLSDFLTSIRVRDLDRILREFDDLGIDEMSDLVDLIDDEETLDEVFGTDRKTKMVKRRFVREAKKWLKENGLFE